MKRLLLVTTTPETWETILKDQPLYLKDFFEVAICSSPGMNEDYINDNGVVYFSVDMVRGINVFKDFVSIVKMILVILKYKPHLVHSYTPKAGLVAMVASWICRVSVRVHTFTGLVFPSTFGFKRKLLIAVDKLIANAATTIVPESEGVRRDLTTYVTSKIHDVIGCGNVAGVDTEYFNVTNNDVCKKSEEIRKAKFEGASFVFCYVGRINRDKGLVELVDAFQRMPEDVALVLIGEVDNTAPPPEYVLCAIKNDSRIHSLGFQKDIRPGLASANVLVLPSYREGFPNVVLQALSMERPVIVTDVSGANEITIDGENGWIVPVRDSNALYRSMKEAVDTSSERLQRMGREGRNRVALRHERMRYLNNLSDFYQSLLS